MTGKYQNILVLQAFLLVKVKTHVFSLWIFAWCMLIWHVSPTFSKNTDGIPINCLTAASEKAYNLLTVKKPGSSPNSEKTYYCLISPPPLFACASHCAHSSQIVSLCFSPLFDLLLSSSSASITKLLADIWGCHLPLAQFWPTQRALPPSLCFIPLIHKRDERSSPLVTATIFYKTP